MMSPVYQNKAAAMLFKQRDPETTNLTLMLVNVNFTAPTWYFYETIPKCNSWLCGKKNPGLFLSKLTISVFEPSPLPEK